MPQKITEIQMQVLKALLGGYEVGWQETEELPYGQTYTFSAQVYGSRIVKPSTATLRSLVEKKLIQQSSRKQNGHGYTFSKDGERIPTYNSFSILFELTDEGRRIANEAKNR